VTTIEPGAAGGSAGRRRGGGLDLHLALGGGGSRQGRSLEAALRDAVRSGRLPVGARLPGTRSLAADLGLSRGTVVHAYAQLVAEGWLVGTQGSGTRVAETLQPPADETGRGQRPERPRPPALDLRPGRPDLSSFPRGLWAAAVRRAFTSVPYDDLGQPDPGGLPGLRAAVADYVARTRGVRADPGAVVITAGFGGGLALLARALHGQGVRAVATENPGLARHRELLHAAGLETRSLPVTPSGADPGALAEAGALTGPVGAALLTPAHQHPRGVVLAPGHRAAFVAWARRNDAYLVEDDYDGEFRYDREAVGALQALAPDRVVYAGTVSKALVPGLRLGWLVLPAALRRPLLRAAEESGTAVGVTEQLAVADLLRRGDYDRQVRRMRLLYRRRRAELAEALPTRLDGVPAGLHALLPVGSVRQERELIARGREAGLLLHGLHSNGYWAAPADGQPAALVLGFATPPAHAWRPALDALTGVLDWSGAATPR